MKNEQALKKIIVVILVFVTFWFGFKPLFLGTSFENYTKIKVSDYNFEENEYATIIIGSEPEGIASAIASSRTGLKTLLITEDSDLGSYIRKSMISRMNPSQVTIKKKKTPLNRGIYQEIFGKIEIGFSAEDYARTVKKLVDAEDSLHVIYDSYIQQVDIEGSLLKGILVKQPDGTHYYKARNFIDATQNGQLLILCKTPYTKGSEDLGVPDFYSPVEFNFRISGVDLEALKKSQKVSSFSDEFTNAILAYTKVNPRTKIVSPSFISQKNNELVITGLRVFGVDVEDEKEMQEAFDEAEEEAIVLTAYLKTVLTAFKNCTYAGSPEEFFIPEYRHFQGTYKLTVGDILENRDFKDKIALCSEAVDASKFIDKNLEYIVVKPKIYAIPLGCIIPSNLTNVLMTGAKASYSSLAASSAEHVPTQITIGESAGLIAAYSFISDIEPYRIPKLNDQELVSFEGYIRRGGVNLIDFDESIKIGKTEQKLIDHWSYPYIKTLCEYGLIAGGNENDYKLDYKASSEMLTVLIKNVVIKIAPDYYSLEFDQAMNPFEIKKELTGEAAASIVLKARNIPFDNGKALETLKAKKIIPASITDRLIKDGTVTMDVVYCIAVETVKSL